MRSLPSPVFALLLAACGSPPPAAEPAPPASTAKAPPPVAPSAAEPPASPPPPSPVAAAEAPSAEPRPEPSPATPSQTVGERLLTPTLAYMLNYSSSGAKEKAAAGCTAASGDDPAARAACMDKERAKLVSDVLVFDKAKGGVVWTIYKRSGNTLSELWRGPVELTADTPERVVVKILKVDREKGFRQLFAGKKEVTITSASDYSVELDDPVFGKLVYESRIGLVDHKAE